MSGADAGGSVKGRLSRFSRNRQRLSDGDEDDESTPDQDWSAPPPPLADEQPSASSNATANEKVRRLSSMMGRRKTSKDKDGDGDGEGSPPTGGEPPNGGGAPPAPGTGAVHMVGFGNGPPPAEKKKVTRPSLSSMIGRRKSSKDRDGDGEGEGSPPSSFQRA